MGNLPCAVSTCHTRERERLGQRTGLVGETCSHFSLIRSNPIQSDQLTIGLFVEQYVQRSVSCWTIPTINSQPGSFNGHRIRRASQNNVFCPSSWPCLAFFRSWSSDIFIYHTLEDTRFGPSCWGSQTNGRDSGVSLTIHHYHRLH